MLQRVGLAQALMHEPRLLILDEPTDGVDPVGRRQIRDILEALEKKGVTIFLNSHLLVEVELFCRDVAIIHKGKVALQGSVTDLTAGSGYKVEAEHVPDNLAAELRTGAKTISHSNGTFHVLFDDREAANRALDLLRGATLPDREIRPRQQHSRRSLHKDGRWQINASSKPGPSSSTPSARPWPAKSSGDSSVAPPR